MNQNCFVIIFTLLFCTSYLTAQNNDSLKLAQSKYLFTYFKGNGEDGLHLAVSNDGLKWEALRNDSSFYIPTARKNELMRDPCILFGPDKKYHLTWTIGWWEKAVGYAESSDLIHWSNEKCIPVMENEKDALNCWAPELFYDEVKKQYMIFWATTIPGRFPESDGGEDKAPSGARLNHRLYYMTTKDFESFSNTKLFYNHGFNVIDATIIKDESRYLMFLKDETNKPYKPQKNIRIAIADNAFGTYSKPTESISGKSWAEGPTVIKIENKWYVYFDKYMEGKYGLIVSEDLINWKDLSDELCMPKGIRHGTVIKIN